jgi:hAT family C-terminal dimerisation region
MQSADRLSKTDVTMLTLLACLLDPSYCNVLLSADLSSLLHAAKMLIIKLSQENTDGEAEPSPHDSSDNGNPALKRFKFLSSRMAASTSQPAASGSSSVDVHSTVIGQLNRYLADAADRNATPDALTFWQNRRDAFSKLTALAEDVIAAPASQALVERIFSSYGMLTTGRRNRTGNAGISKTECKHCLICLVCKLNGIIRSQPYI